jgi:hypothetical protein
MDGFILSTFEENRRKDARKKYFSFFAEGGDTDPDRCLMKRKE